MGHGLDTPGTEPGKREAHYVIQYMKRTNGVAPHSRAKLLSGRAAGLSRPSRQKAPRVSISLSGSNDKRAVRVTRRVERNPGKRCGVVMLFCTAPYCSLNKPAAMTS